MHTVVTKNLHSSSPEEANLCFPPCDSTGALSKCLYLSPFFHNIYSTLVTGTCISVARICISWPSAIGHWALMSLHKNTYPVFQGEISWEPIPPSCGKWVTSEHIITGSPVKPITHLIRLRYLFRLWCYFSVLSVNPSCYSISRNNTAVRKVKWGVQSDVEIGKLLSVQQQGSDELFRAAW